VLIIFPSTACAKMLQLTEQYGQMVVATDAPFVRSSAA
jgi:hypothetical protein